MRVDDQIDIKKMLAEISHQLASVTDSPALEAELLLAHLLQKPRSYFYMNDYIFLTDAEKKLLQEYVIRRLQKEPIAYITGVKEFWSLALCVTRDTLIPRPETELIVETVINLFPASEKKTIIDLGTGSGAIALAVAKERPAWQIIATDQSEAALAIAKKNAHRLTVSNIIFLKSNWCDALTAEIKIDAIVSNPPYISQAEWLHLQHDLAYEPIESLISEDDGLADIKSIIKQSKNLNPHYLIVEHGYLQAEAVRNAFAEAGYRSIESKCDLAGCNRITMGSRVLISNI